MTFVRIFAGAALLCAGQVLGVLLHPDPWVTLAVAVSLGAGAFTAHATRGRPS